MPVASPAVQIVDIPLAKILENPDNPRHVITQEMIDSQAAMQSNGLNNPIKVTRGSGEGDYVVVSGHIRLAAARKLRWETIPAQVLELTPEEARKLAYQDNRGQQMHWLDDVIYIERRSKDSDVTSQQQLADELGVTQSTINNALKVAKTLNPASREQIYQNLIISGGKTSISEAAVRTLADLGDPLKVEGALKVALEKRMTEAQVRQMVHPDGKKPKRVKATQPAMAAPAQAVTPAPAPEPKTTQASGDGLKDLVMGGSGGVLIGFLAANFKRALGTLVRRYMLHALAALGVLAYLAFHGVGNLFKPKTANLSVANPVPAQTVPEPKAPVPVVAAKAPAKKEAGHKPSSVKVTSSEAPKATGGSPVWASEGIPLVKDFANRFYNRSYPTWEADQDYLKARMTADYGPVFLKQYYLPAQRVELRDKQEVQAFSNAQPPVVVGGEGNSSQYRVQGQLTLQNRSGKMAKNVWTKQVALEISVRHEEGIGYWVEKVTEVAPQTSEKSGLSPGASAQGADPTAKFVGDAAGEAAKKLLGL
jgi:ParB/RepB/Spo0J family partition protein